MATALLIESRLPKHFWPDVVQTAAYILNRSSVSNKDKVPAERFYDNRVNVDKLRVFGAIGYSHIPKHFRKKFDIKFRTGVLICYYDAGYRLYDPFSRKDFYSRNVIFDESKRIIYIECDQENVNADNSLLYFINFEDDKQPVWKRDTEFPMVTPACHKRRLREARRKTTSHVK